MPPPPDYHDDRDADKDEWPDDEDDSTVPCPYCRRDIHEDTPRCPYCENYLSREDAPSSAKPWWIVLGTLLGMYAIYRWIVG